jgi:hypothetical protein
MSNRPIADWTPTVAKWVAGFVFLLGSAGTLVASYFQWWWHWAPPSNLNIDPSQLGPSDIDAYVPWESWQFSHEFLLGMPIVAVAAALLAWLAPWEMARKAMGTISLIVGCAGLVIIGLWVYSSGIVMNDTAFHIVRDPGIFMGLGGWVGLLTGAILLVTSPGPVSQLLNRFSHTASQGTQ